MKKFGFKSKSDNNNGKDPNRNALFGSRSSKSTTTTTPPSSNPYALAAQNGPPDPYAQDTNKYANMGPTFVDGAKTQGRSAAAAGYGADKKQSVGGYAAGYAANGYGGDRYGAQNNYASSTRGPAGYGGLGPAPTQEADDNNRTALFGGAKDRLAQKPAAYNTSEQAPATTAASEQDNQFQPAYGDRQLTAEEEEEEDVSATKQNIRFLKQSDVSSTRNALRVAAQAEDSGRETLTRLGAQGERIHNTEKNLDLAGNTNRVAEERARELKTLNKSMFAVHVSNPFTAKSRKLARDEEVLDRHRAEREVREETRQRAFESRARMENHSKDVGGGGPANKGIGKPSLAERAKYQFEADSEDDEMENEIEGNLDALNGAAGRLNALARATGKEVDEQNVHIDRIAAKSDKVDDQIAMNRAKLDRFH